MLVKLQFCEQLVGCNIVKERVVDWNMRVLYGKENARLFQETEKVGIKLEK